MYDRAFRKHHYARDLAAAREGYERLISNHPDDVLAKYARVQLQNIEHALYPASVFRKPNFPDVQFGRWLKTQAKPGGVMVGLRLPNVYACLNSLAQFFYYKKHEWLVFAFFDEELVCVAMWVNKGDDRQSVAPLVNMNTIFAHCEKLGLKYVIRAHNHPISMLDHEPMPNRQQGIAAFYSAKAAMFDFSGQDLASHNYFKHLANTNGMQFADALFAAGSYQFFGCDDVLANHNANAPYRPERDPVIALVIKLAMATVIVGIITYCSIAFQ